jgi:hypothetical protein
MFAVKHDARKHCALDLFVLGQYGQRSTARRLDGSTARRLDGSTARRLDGSTARRLDGSTGAVPGNRLPACSHQPAA